MGGSSGRRPCCRRDGVDFLNDIYGIGSDYRAADGEIERVRAMLMPWGYDVRADFGDSVRA